MSQMDHIDGELMLRSNLSSFHAFKIMEYQYSSRCVFTKWPTLVLEDCDKLLPNQIISM